MYMVVVDMKIYCCGCEKEVEARLTNGREIYRGRSDLKDIPFWKCDVCKNYVGCHYKTNKPLGSIPTAELRKARRKIHDVLDPLWKHGGKYRGSLYKKLSDRLGYQFHSGELNSLEEAERVYQAVAELETG